MNDQEEKQDRPSKSARKREFIELQKLADQMSHLSNKQLRNLSIDGPVLDALAELREIPPSGARNRQLKYCVKFMDEDELDEVRAFLADRTSQQVSANQVFHQIEQWRDRLIAEGDKALEAFIDEFPQVDRQHLRRLLRDAAREKESGKPVGAGRKLFRELRALAL